MRIIILITFFIGSFNLQSQGLINITNYTDSIYPSDTLIIEVRSAVRDNGYPASPLALVTDTLNNGILSFDLTFDFTGVWSMGWTRTDTLYYSNIPNLLDSIKVFCYYNAVDSFYNPPRHLAIRHDTDSVIIHIIHPTALQEYHSKEKICLFPNPTNGAVNIEIEKPSQGNYNLKVVDLVGREVFIKEEIELDDYGKPLNLSELDTGVYLFILENNDKRFVHKLVVR